MIQNSLEGDEKERKLLVSASQRRRRLVKRGKEKEKLWAFVFLRLYSRESRVYIQNGRIYRGEESLEHMRYPSIPPSIVVSLVSPFASFFGGLLSPPSGRAHICKINGSWNNNSHFFFFCCFSSITFSSSWSVGATQSLLPDTKHPSRPCPM